TCFAASSPSLQRGDLVGVVHSNDLHVLVTLVFLQADVLRSVEVTEAVHFVKLVWNIDQVLIDDRLRCLGTFSREFLVDGEAARGGSTPDHNEQNFAPPAVAGDVIQKIDQPVVLQPTRS